MVIYWYRRWALHQVFPITFVALSLSMGVILWDTKIFGIPLNAILFVVASIPVGTLVVRSSSQTLGRRFTPAIIVSGALMLSLIPIIYELSVLASAQDWYFYRQLLYWPMLAVGSAFFLIRNGSAGGHFSWSIPIRAGVTVGLVITLMGRLFPDAGLPSTQMGPILCLFAISFFFTRHAGWLDPLNFYLATFLFFVEQSKAITFGAPVFMILGLIALYRDQENWRLFLKSASVNFLHGSLAVFSSAIILALVPIVGRQKRIAGLSDIVAEVTNVSRTVQRTVVSGDQVSALELGETDSSSANVLRRFEWWGDALSQQLSDPSGLLIGMGHVVDLAPGLDSTVNLHNSFLEIFARGGLLGAIVFVPILVALLISLKSFGSSVETTQLILLSTAICYVALAQPTFLFPHAAGVLGFLIYKLGLDESANRARLSNP